VMVLIRRGRDLLIPHGDTIISAGDTVTVLCERGCIDEIRSLFSTVPEKTPKP
jgi:Trk K+ transport system NAD-binding subunit